MAGVQATITPTLRGATQTAMQVKKLYHILLSASIGDILHEISNLVFFLEKKRKVFQNVVCWKFYPEC